MEIALIALAIAAVAGPLVVYFLLKNAQGDSEETDRLRRLLDEAKRDQQDTQSELSGLQSTLRERDQAQAELKTELQQARDKLSETEQQLSSRKAELENAHQRKTELDEQVKEQGEVIERQRNEFSELKDKYTSLNAEYDALKEKLNTQKQELEQTKKELYEEFKNVTNKLLAESGEEFKNRSGQKVEELLKPFKEQLNNFKAKVEETHEKRSNDHVALREQIKQLTTLNQQVTQEARNLTNALKGEAKQQGNWGEQVLERIIQVAGLREGRDYEKEKSFTVGHEEDANQERLRPDYIVHLPADDNGNSRSLIIDSKVSLTAYTEYTEAETPEEADRALKAHIGSVRKHIDSLSGKDYTSIAEINSPEYILLFMPIEAAMLTALDEDPSLFQTAFEKKIVLVGPTTLFSTLHMVHGLWRQNRQNQNAIKIAEEAGKMYDKFVLLDQGMDKVRTRFKQADESLQTVSDRINGHGGLIGKVQRLKDMGAKAKKSIPENKLPDNGQDEEEAAGTIEEASSEED